MTIKKILWERYKVIGPFPDSPYQINDIITPDTEEPDIWVIEGAGLKSPELHNHPNSYPNIFKKLEWWEARKVEDMPEYIVIGTKLGRQVVKVDSYTVNGFHYTEGTQHFLLFGYTQPATEQEYNDFKKI